MNNNDFGFQLAQILIEKNSRGVATMIFRTTTLTLVSMLSLATGCSFSAKSGNKQSSETSSTQSDQNQEAKVSTSPTGENGSVAKAGDGIDLLTGTSNVDSETVSHLYLADAFESQGSMSGQLGLTGSEDANVLDSGLLEELDSEERAFFTSEREAEIKRVLLDIADLDDSGTLSKEEFVSMRLTNASLNIQSINELEIKRIARFNGADKNSDNVLSGQEIDDMIVGARAEVKALRRYFTVDEIKAMFEKYNNDLMEKFDSDGDGKLDAVEKKTVRTRIKTRVDQEIVDLSKTCAIRANRTGLTKLACSIWDEVQKECSELKKDPSTIRFILNRVCKRIDEAL